MTIKDLDPVRGHVAILQAVKSKRDALKEAEDNAKAAIQDFLGDADTGTLDGEVVITWSHSKRNAFDQVAFRAAHPDLYESFKTPSSVRRFELK